MAMKNDNLNKKNLYCRDARANEIINILGRSPFTQGKGYHIRKCIYESDCKGAHCKEEIQYYPHISRFNNLDKSTFNFPELNNEILQIISNEKMKMKGNTEEFKERLNKIIELNFIELVQLWHDLACFYRKLSKKIPRRHMNITDSVHTSGYKYSEEVPNFYLSETSEDFCWAFYRITIFCPIHQSFLQKIDKKDSSLTIWDICLGDKNCKEGIHHTREFLCIDDFLFGKCDCESKDIFDNNKKSLENDIVKNEEKYNIETNINKKNKLSILIKNLKNRLHIKQRKIHFTEQRMIPFNIQNERYKKNIETEKAKVEEEEQKKLIQPIKKVIKISLGKK